MTRSEGFDALYQAFESKQMLGEPGLEFRALGIAVHSFGAVEEKLLTVRCTRAVTAAQRCVPMSRKTLPLLGRLLGMFPKTWSDVR